MLAIVEAEISTRLRAPRCSRSGASVPSSPRTEPMPCLLLTSAALPGKHCLYCGAPARLAERRGWLDFSTVMRRALSDCQPAPLGELLDVGVATRPAAEARLAETAKRGERLVLRCASLTCTIRRSGKRFPNRRNVPERPGARKSSSGRRGEPPASAAYVAGARGEPCECSGPQRFRGRFVVRVQVPTFLCMRAHPDNKRARPGKIICGSPTLPSQDTRCVLPLSRGLARPCCHGVSTSPGTGTTRGWSRSRRSGRGVRPSLPSGPAASAQL